MILVIAPRLSSRDLVHVGAVAYGLVVFAAMWFGGLRLVHQVMLKVKPPVFAISCIMWGAALALRAGVAARASAPTAPRPRLWC
jgi:hypothetical protein